MRKAGDWSYMIAQCICETKISVQKSAFSIDSSIATLNLDFAYFNVAHKPNLYYIYKTFSFSDQTTVVHTAQWLIF